MPIPEIVPTIEPPDLPLPPNVDRLGLGSLLAPNNPEFDDFSRAAPEIVIVDNLEHLQRRRQQGREQLAVRRQIAQAFQEDQRQQETQSRGADSDRIGSGPAGQLLLGGVRGGIRLATTPLNLVALQSSVSRGIAQAILPESLTPEHVKQPTIFETTALKVHQFLTKHLDEPGGILASSTAGQDFPWKNPDYWASGAGEAFVFLIAMLVPASAAANAAKVAGASIKGIRAAQAAATFVASTALEGGMAYPDFVDGLIERGLTPDEAGIIGGYGTLGYAAVAGALEVVSVDRLLAKGLARKQIMRALVAIATEAVTEELQEEANIATEKILDINDPATNFQRRITSFILGAGVSAPIAVMTTRTQQEQVRTFDAEVEAERTKVRGAFQRMTPEERASQNELMKKVIDDPDASAAQKEFFKKILEISEAIDAPRHEPEAPTDEPPEPTEPTAPRKPKDPRPRTPGVTDEQATAIDEELTEIETETTATRKAPSAREESGLPAQEETTSVEGEGGTDLEAIGQVTRAQAFDILDRIGLREFIAAVRSAGVSEEALAAFRAKMGPIVGRFDRLAAGELDVTPEEAQRVAGNIRGLLEEMGLTKPATTEAPAAPEAPGAAAPAASPNVEAASARMAEINEETAGLVQAIEILQVAVRSAEAGTDIQTTRKITGKAQAKLVENLLAQAEVVSQRLSELESEFNLLRDQTEAALTAPDPVDLTGQHELPIETDVQTPIVLRGFRGVPAEGTVQQDVPDTDRDSRFGRGQYTTASEAVAQEFASFRGEGGRVIEVEVRLATPFNFDAPDVNTTEYRRLTEILEGMGIEIPEPAEPGDSVDFRGVMTQLHENAGSPSAFFPGGVEFRQVLLDAGYDGVISRLVSPDFPASIEVVSFGEPAAPAEPRGLLSTIAKIEDTLLLLSDVIRSGGNVQAVIDFVRDEDTGIPDLVAALEALDEQGELTQFEEQQAAGEESSALDLVGALMRELDTQRNARLDAEPGVTVTLPVEPSTPADLAPAAPRIQPITAPEGTPVDQRPTDVSHFGFAQSHLLLINLDVNELLALVAANPSLADHSGIESAIRDAMEVAGADREPSLDAEAVNAMVDALSDEQLAAALITAQEKIEATVAIFDRQSAFPSEHGMFSLIKQFSGDEAFTLKQDPDVPERSGLILRFKAPQRAAKKGLENQVRVGLVARGFDIKFDDKGRMFIEPSTRRIMEARQTRLLRASRLPGRPIRSIAVPARATPVHDDIIRKMRAKGDIDAEAEARLRAPDDLHINGEAITEDNGILGFRATLFHATGRPTGETVYSPGADGPTLGPGRYSALSEAHARPFGPTVEAVAVRLEIPLVIRDDEALVRAAQQGGFQGMRIPEDSEGRNSFLQAVRDFAINEGHDGIVIIVQTLDTDSVTGKDIRRLQEIFDISQVVEFSPLATTESDVIARIADVRSAQNVEAITGNATARIMLHEWGKFLQEQKVDAIEFADRFRDVVWPNLDMGQKSLARGWIDIIVGITEDDENPAEALADEVKKEFFRNKTKGLQDFETNDEKLMAFAALDEIASRVGEGEATEVNPQLILRTAVDLQVRDILSGFTPLSEQYEELRRVLSDLAPFDRIAHMQDIDVLIAMEQLVMNARDKESGFVDPNLPDLARKIAARIKEIEDGDTEAGGAQAPAPTPQPTQPAGGSVTPTPPAAAPAETGGFTLTAEDVTPPGVGGVSKLEQDLAVDTDGLSGPTAVPRRVTKKSLVTVIETDNFIATDDPIARADEAVLALANIPGEMSMEDNEGILIDPDSSFVLDMTAQQRKSLGGRIREGGDDQRDRIGALLYDRAVLALISGGVRSPRGTISPNQLRLILDEIMASPDQYEPNVVLSALLIPEYDRLAEDERAAIGEIVDQDPEVIRLVEIAEQNRTAGVKPRKRFFASDAQLIKQARRKAAKPARKTVKDRGVGTQGLRIHIPASRLPVGSTFNSLGIEFRVLEADLGNGETIVVLQTDNLRDTGIPVSGLGDIPVDPGTLRTGVLDGRSVKVTSGFGSVTTVGSFELTQLLVQTEQKLASVHHKPMVRMAFTNPDVTVEDVAELTGVDVAKIKKLKPSSTEGQASRFTIRIANDDEGVRLADKLGGIRLSGDVNPITVSPGETAEFSGELLLDDPRQITQPIPSRDTVKKFIADGRPIPDRWFAAYPELEAEHTGEIIESAVIFGQEGVIQYARELVERSRVTADEEVYAEQTSRFMDLIQAHPPDSLNSENEAIMQSLINESMDILPPSVRPLAAPVPVEPAMTLQQRLRSVDLGKQLTATPVIPIERLYELDQGLQPVIENRILVANGIEAANVIGKGQDVSAAETDLERLDGSIEEVLNAIVADMNLSDVEASIVLGYLDLIVQSKINPNDLAAFTSQAISNTSRALTEANVNLDNASVQQLYGLAESLGAESVNVATGRDVDPAAFAESQASQPSLLFVSGMQRAPADLRATIARGVPVGVSLTQALSRNVVAELVAYANAGGKVFIDNGAFTAFAGGEEVNWDAIGSRWMSIIQDVVPDQRGNIWIVAPDIIGDQGASLALQENAANSWLQPLIEAGVNIIVPIHTGEESPHSYLSLISDSIDITRITLGIPFEERAWSETAVLNFIRENQQKGLPQRPIHLLGAGVERVESMRSKIQAIAPGTQVNGDASRIRRLVGQGKSLTERTAEIIAKREASLGRPLDRKERSQSRTQAIIQIETEAGLAQDTGPALDATSLLASDETEETPSEQFERQKTWFSTHGFQESGALTAMGQEELSTLMGEAGISLPDGVIETPENMIAAIGRAQKKVVDSFGGVIVPPDDVRRLAKQNRAFEEHGVRNRTDLERMSADQIFDHANVRFVPIVTVNGRKLKGKTILAILEAQARFSTDRAAESRHLALTGNADTLEQLGRTRLASIAAAIGASFPEGAKARGIVQAIMLRRAEIKRQGADVPAPDATNALVPFLSPQVQGVEPNATPDGRNVDGLNRGPQNFAPGEQVFMIDVGGQLVGGVVTGPPTGEGLLPVTIQRDILGGRETIDVDPKFLFKARDLDLDPNNLVLVDPNDPVSFLPSTFDGLMELTRDQLVAAVNLVAADFVPGTEKAPIANAILDAVETKVDQEAAELSDTPVSPDPDQGLFGERPAEGGGAAGEQGGFGFTGTSQVDDADAADRAARLRRLDADAGATDTFDFLSDVREIRKDQPPIPGFVEVGHLGLTFHVRQGLNDTEVGSEAEAKAMMRAIEDFVRKPPPGGRRGRGNDPAGGARRGFIDMGVWLGPILQPVRAVGRVGRDIGGVVLNMAVLDLFDLVGRSGGKTARKAAVMGRAAVNTAKMTTGQLSKQLRKVMRVTGGVPFVSGNVGPIQAQKAAISFQHVDMIVVTPDPEVTSFLHSWGTANGIDLIEGRLEPKNEAEQRIVDALRGLIDKTGQIFLERQHLQFNFRTGEWEVFRYIPGGRVYPRLMHQDLIAIIGMGPGRMWNATVEAIVAANADFIEDLVAPLDETELELGVTIEQKFAVKVGEFLQSLREAFLGQGGPTSFHRINAEFTRSIPRFPSHIIPLDQNGNPGDRLELLETHPWMFGRRLADNAGNRVGFIEQFGQAIGGWQIINTDTGEMVKHGATKAKLNFLFKGLNAEEKNLKKMKVENLALVVEALDPDVSIGGLDKTGLVELIFDLREGRGIDGELELVQVPNIIDDMRTAILREPGGSPKHFLTLTRVLNGMPAEPPILTAGSPIRSAARAAQNLGSLARSSMLTMAIVPNLVEFAGNIQALSNTEDLIRTVWDVVGVRKDADTGQWRSNLAAMIVTLESMGAITADLANVTWNPNRPFESITRIFREAIGRGIPRIILEEFQEKVAGIVALHKVQRMASGSSTFLEVENDVIDLMAMMSWNKAFAETVAKGGGSTEDYLAVVRRAPAFMTGGAIRAAEKTRLSQNRLYRVMIAFELYAQIKIRSMAKLMGAYNKAYKSRDAKLFLAANLKMSRYVGGTAVAGQLQYFLLALVTGGWDGVEIAWEEMKDNPWQAAWHSFAYAMFAGPYGSLIRMATANDGAPLGEQLMSMTLPGFVIDQGVRAISGTHQYANMDPMERVGRYFQRMIPVTKVWDSMMALFAFGHARESLKFQTAKSAYWRWRFESGRRPATGDRGDVADDDREFRIGMRQAWEARMRWDDPRPGLQRALRVVGRSELDVRRSILGRRLLVKHDALEIRELTDRIGADAVEQLAIHDGIMEGWAAGFVKDKGAWAR